MANTVKVGITATDEGFKSTMDQMKQSAENFGSSLDSAGKKSQTLNGAFRAARKEASDLALAYHQLDETAKNSDFGKQMKAQLDQALQAAGELADLKGDVAAEIKNIASDTMAWDAAAQGIGVVSSGLQGLASAYGLLGGDVQAFTQALVAVNAVQSVANTIIGIGNALQKQSALMVGLRAAKTALFGTTEAAATVAETANTAATTANTTATAANTAAKGANTAANVGQTAATTAATTAQLANNAAVLANPYVLAAAAVVALTGAIVAWYISMDDATDSEAALTAATDAFNEEVDSAMKTVGEQIALYDDLKRQYDSSGAKVDEFAKKLINNTEVQKKLGVVVKTVDDVHKLFAKNSEAYRRATLARASALAAETAQATMLGKTLAELSKVQAKLAAGEEVNWTDLKDIVKAAGYNDRGATEILIKAGFEVEGEFFGKDNVKKATGDFNKLISEITKGGAYKALQDIGDNFAAQFNDIDNIDFNGMLTSATDALEKVDSKIEKSGKKGQKTAKKTADQIKEIFTSLEGCDAIIQHAENDMKKLDSTSADYNEKLEKAKNLILTARISKLKLLDRTTIDGLTQSKQLIEQIIKSLPEGHEKLEPIKKELAEINEKIYEFLSNAAKNGDIKSLSDARSQVENIIKELPEGSSELVRWVRIWRDINDKIVEAQQEVEDLKKGIQKGSATWIQREISKLKSEISNLDLNIDGNVELVFNKQEEIRQLEQQLGEIKEKSEGLTVTLDVNIDTKFDYKKSPLEKLERDIDEYKKRLSELENIKETDVSAETFKEITKRISELKSKIGELSRQHTFAEMADDIKTYSKEVRSASLDTTKGFVDGMHTLYNVITDLPERLDECKDGFEGFFEIMDAGFSIIDSITAFIENIQKLTQAITLLDGAQQSMDATKTSLFFKEHGDEIKTALEKISQARKSLADANMIQAQSTKQETAAEEQNTIATMAGAVADASAAEASMGKAGANVAEGASETGAQNAKLGPFGWIVGIAAALAFAGALFGILGQAKGFASGGIIQGKTTMGDQILARVNAGEMILNKKQQANLFNMLDTGKTKNQGTNLITSSVRIKGSDLIVALKNEDRTTGALSKYLNK